MNLSLKMAAIEDLPRTTASDIKKLGWRGVMRSVGLSGRVVVTNHNEAEAVILSAQDYGQMVQALQAAAAQTEPALEALRQRFDQRLASLQAPEAGERLRAVMGAGPVKLGAKVKVASIKR